MSRHQLWQLLPLALPVVSYVIGKQRSKLRVPKSIARLISNNEVVGIIVQGIEIAQVMQDKSDDEKRQYVRSWAKSELYKLIGEWLPDSAVNFLIEHTIVRRKAA